MVLLMSPPVGVAEDSAVDPMLQSLGRDFDRNLDRLLALAKAIPPEKYDWRPEEGARSVSEVFTHVAGGNYFFAAAFGIPMPDGLTFEAADPGPGVVFDIEKTVTGKDYVIAILEASGEHVRQALNAWNGRLDENARLVTGQEVSSRDLWLLTIGHPQQHLGQAIAYARMNRIAPPWSVPTTE